MKTLNKLAAGIALFSCLGASAYATSAHPVYVGAGFGYSALSTPSDDVFSPGSGGNGNTVIAQTESEDTLGGFGGIGVIGVMLNEHMALEADYVSYADSNYKSTQQQYTNGSVVGTSTATIDYTTQSIGLFLKGIKPISRCLSVSAKIGADYVMEDVDYNNPGQNPTISVDNSKLATPKEGDHSYQKWFPAAGVSLIANINQHVSTSVFFEGYLGDSDSDLESQQDAIPSAYITGIRLNYLFG